jgi:hypothetical protein
MNIYQRALPLLREVREQIDDSGKLPLSESELEENRRAVLHWVKKKYGAAKAAAHRAFLQMVRKDPAAHARKMREDQKYRRTHKWHDALMRKTSRPGWKREAKEAGGGYEPYCDFGSGSFTAYLEANPDLDPDEFGRFVTAHNQADRDSGELDDIASGEIARLGVEFAKARGLGERDAGQAFMDLPFELRVTEQGPCPKCGCKERPGADGACPRCGAMMAAEEVDPSSMKVQTLIFSKDKFSKKSAVKWAKSHGFTAAKVDEKENTYRLRQRDPDEFETFRTISFKPGLKAVVAKV